MRNESKDTAAALIATSVSTLENSGQVPMRLPVAGSVEGVISLSLNMGSRIGMHTVNLKSLA